MNEGGCGIIKHRVNASGKCEETDQKAFSMDLVNAGFKAGSAIRVITRKRLVVAERLVRTLKVDHADTVLNGHVDPRVNARLRDGPKDI